MSELPLTLPMPEEWPNKPWSLPPCPNASPEGHACTLSAHTIERATGTRRHGAQVKVSRLYLPIGAMRRKRATYSEWTNWLTRDQT